MRLGRQTAIQARGNDITHATRFLSQQAVNGMTAALLCHITHVSGGVSVISVSRVVLWEHKINSL